MALARPKQGSICVQPLALRSFSLCHSGKLSVSVDKGAKILWPRGNPVKIGGLDLDQSHIVTASCDGKPVQSARFKFSEYKSDELCLLFQEMFDGYEGLRLWDAGYARRWCKKCR
jgi:hypothetical protein